MGGKKIFCLFFVLSISFITIFSPYVVKNVLALNAGEFEAQKNVLKEKNSALKKDLDSKKGEIKTSEKETENINTKLTNTQEQINTTKKDIEILKEISIALEMDITACEEQKKENLEILKKRLNAICLAQEISFLDICLESKSFEEFMDKAELISKIGERDSNLISVINQQLSKIKVKQNELNNNKVHLEKKQIELSENEKTLSDLLAKNKEHLDILNVQAEGLEESLAQSEAEFNKVQKDLENFYADQARKKAEEAKRNTPSGLNQLKSTQVFSKAYAWPVPGYNWVIAPFGEIRGNYVHKGVDITGAGIMGKPIVAVESGTVIATYTACSHNFGKSRSCGCGGGYGNYIMLAFPSGKGALYGHLSSVSVSPGQTVQKGQQIGTIGSTGHSTGAHLHFETFIGRTRYNPMNEY